MGTATLGATRPCLRLIMNPPSAPRILLRILAFAALLILSSYTARLAVGGRVRDWARELDRATAELALPQAPRERFEQLPHAAMAAFECGQAERARAYATEALQSAPQFRKDWSYGNAIHAGHVVLGRTALARGDLDTACGELLLAGRTPGSPQLDSFGPNMSLARDLLRAGRRDVVLDYLEACGTFWRHDFGALARWRLMVRLHLPPDFGSNLGY